MTLKLAGYQSEVVEKLTEAVVKAWDSGKEQVPIVLKSPTGSGKTFMLAHFVRELNHLPAWDADKAFIWITFSEDLALQSRDKFEAYFGTSQENGLLTVDDLSQGKLKKNDILFLNWQKLVSKSAENRKLRRPEDQRLQKEQGVYFEDFIDGTQLDSRSIILIIDEAHTNVTPDLAQEIINYVAPRAVLHVSATPKPETVAKAADFGTYINVARERVIDEGLIKEKIVIQTAEDLEKHKGEDFDHTLIDLGLTKRESLKAQYEALGKNINPLLLIQLPNDDSSLVSLGEKTKEQVVVDYLTAKGIDPKRIGRWFDDHAKPQFIEDNDDNHDILIFKLAAGTGWDCPRAQVLVMFRNIKVEQRYIQTVGRILRTPDPQNASEYANNPDLRSGYLFTNYHREDVVNNWIDQKQDSPLVLHAHKREGLSPLALPSDFLSRTDYGDLSSSSRFQMSFCASMDKWFGFSEADMIADRHKLLEKRGLKLDGHVTNKVVADAEFVDFDHLTLDFKQAGVEVDVEMSTNDVEKTFNLMCWTLLKEQTEDDAKVSNLSRSWSPLKSAFRVWFRNAVGEDSSLHYRILIADLAKGAASSLRPAVTQALKDYKPILEEIVAEREVKHREMESTTFTIQDTYSFPSDYEAKSFALCALDNLYLPRDNYAGKQNESEFIEFLESQPDKIEWWFKQGIGRDYFGVAYVDASTKRSAMFYPDWIIRLLDGRTIVLDTKGGITARDAEERANALATRMSSLEGDFSGGIAVKSGGVWFANMTAHYQFDAANLGSDWEPLTDVFS